MLHRYHLKTIFLIWGNPRLVVCVVFVLGVYMCVTVMWYYITWMRSMLTVRTRVHYADASRKAGCIADVSRTPNGKKGDVARIYVGCKPFT